MGDPEVNNEDLSCRSSSLTWSYNTLLCTETLHLIPSVPILHYHLEWSCISTTLAPPSERKPLLESLWGWETVPVPLFLRAIFPDDPFWMNVYRWLGKHRRHLLVCSLNLPENRTDYEFHLASGWAEVWGKLNILGFTRFTSTLIDQRWIRSNHSQ